MNGDIETYLEAVRHVIQDVMQSDLAGLWVVGSLATGGFLSSRSDIDVLGACTQPMGAAQRDELAGRLNHRRLNCPAHGLDLLLYRAADLRTPTRAPYYEFSLATGPEWDDDIGLGGPYPGGLLDLAIARTHGITIAGDPAETVIASVPAEWVEEEALRALRWHKQHIHDPFHDPTGTNAVLNACRALRYIRTAQLGSKAEGAEWLLGRRPSPIVEAALRELVSGQGQPLDRTAVAQFLVDAETWLQTDSSGTGPPE